MQINVSTRHGNLSEETREKIRAKLEKLRRYFERLSSVDLTIDLNDEERPLVDLKVSAEHKHDFVASDQSLGLFSSVDAVISKMEQQLRKYKEKVVDRNRGGGTRNQEVSAEREFDEN